MLKQIVMEDGEQKTTKEYAIILTDIGNENHFSPEVVEMAKEIFLEMSEVINEEVLSEETTMTLVNKYREFYLLKWKLGIEE